VFNTPLDPEDVDSPALPSLWSEAEPPEYAFVRMQFSLVKKLEPSADPKIGHRYWSRSRWPLRCQWRGSVTRPTTGETADYPVLALVPGGRDLRRC